jgi:phosphoribosylanthranilate isomerase
MTKVKICGLRSEEDIEIVNALLPDYAGFIFCPSKRHVDIRKALKLCGALDSRIKKAGLFVDQDRGFIEEARKQCGLDVLQLHGNEAPEDCVYEGCEVWKAVRVKSAASIALAYSYDTDRILFDAYDENAYGGSGKAFNWELLQMFIDKGRIILAGGLSQENVNKAVRFVRPFAVDVSSGVETDGKKDFEKVKLFIKNARGFGEHE